MSETNKLKKAKSELEILQKESEIEAKNNKILY